MAYQNGTKFIKILATIDIQIELIRIMIYNFIQKLVRQNFQEKTFKLMSFRLPFPRFPCQNPTQYENSLPLREIPIIQIPQHWLLNPHMDFNLILRMSKDQLKKSVRSVGYSKQSSNQLSELLVNAINNYNELIECLHDKDILRRKCHQLLQSPSLQKTKISDPISSQIQVNA